MTPVPRHTYVKLGLVKEKSYFDRNDWSSGPWNAEPWDYIHWGIHSAPYEGLVIREDDTGSWLGFVAVPRQSVFSGVRRLELPPYIEDNLNLVHVGWGLPDIVEQCREEIAWWTFGFRVKGSTSRYVNVVEIQRRVVEVAAYLYGKEDPSNKAEITGR